MNILVYTLTKNEARELHTNLQKKFRERIHLWMYHSIQQIENALFERRWILFIFRHTGNQIITFSKNLKQDELFQSLPIIMISNTLSFSQSISFCDISLLSYETYILSSHSYSLIRKHILYQKALHDIQEANEQKIENYLMTSIVKRYISRTTYSCIVQSTQKQKLSIQEENLFLTAVFADISNFTKLSETISVQEVITILNILFHTVVPIIHLNGGDIDKFMGDEFFAVFFDSRAALRATQQIQQKIQQIPELVKQKIQLHIGIHYGIVLRGNVGSDERSDHTLIGNTINTASRLESICPPGEIIASTAVIKHADIFVPHMYRRTAKLRGMEGKITYYTLFHYFERNPRILKHKIFSLKPIRKINHMRFKKESGQVIPTAEQKNLV